MKRIALSYILLVLAAALCFGVSLIIQRALIPEINAAPQVSISENTQYLSVTPTAMFGTDGVSIGYANGLVYLAYDDGLYECDTESDVCTNIYENAKGLSCICPYGGYIYAVYLEYITGKTIYEGYEVYHIIKIDYNTHESTTLYTAEQGREIRCMAMTAQGEMYFIERDGYDVSKSFVPQQGFLYSLREGGRPQKLTAADWYYIDDRRLYITRYNAGDDTEKLFISDIGCYDKLTDTGLAVGRNISENGGVMFSPAGDSIYYTDDNYDLCRYDIKSGNSEKIFGFEGDRLIYYFAVFDERMILLVREQMKDERWCYVLYYLDEDNKPVKITDDITLNQGQKYMFEWIECMAMFSGDDVFLLATYDPNIENKVYVIDKDFQMHLVAQSGEWDYEAYEMMKDGMSG